MPSQSIILESSRNTLRRRKREAFEGKRWCTYFENRVQRKRKQDDEINLYGNSAREEKERERKRKGQNEGEIERSRGKERKRTLEAKQRKSKGKK